MNSIMKSSLSLIQTQEIFLETTIHGFVPVFVCKIGCLALECQLHDQP